MRATALLAIAASGCGHGGLLEGDQRMRGVSPASSAGAKKSRSKSMIASLTVATGPRTGSKPRLTGARAGLVWRHLAAGVIWCAGALALAGQSSGPTPVVVTGPDPREEGNTLRWSDAGPGFDYTVQTRDDLRDGLWIAPRAAMPWPVPTREWFDASLVAARSRFYRVVVVPRATRGHVYSDQEIRSVTAAEINLLLQLLGVPLSVSFDVRVLKLNYETVAPRGGRISASGALALPRIPGRPIPLCSYQHGTITKRGEAPSSAESAEQLLGVVMAASGYATVLPDYLGLGDSPGVHPYHHAASEATACVDMLRAARAWCATHGIALNTQLFLFGYSHGGHATMALHRELEEYHASEFTITASAPMAGAYDLSGVTTDDALSGRPMPNPYYFSMLLASYQSVYGLAGSLTDLFAAPYHLTLPPLLDGQHSGGEINAALPADPTKVLKPEYLAAFRNRPDHPLRLALRDNDLYGWTPRAPMRLYHCRGDRDVIARNSQVALDSFHARGATQVRLIDPDPSADHDGCSIPSLLLAKEWFDSLRKNFQ